MDNPVAAVDQDSDDSYRYNQHIPLELGIYTPIEIALPIQHQHQHINGDQPSAEFSTQPWLRANHPHQDDPLHNPNLHNASLLTNEDLPLASNGIQHLGDTSVAPDSPNSMSTYFSDLSSTAAFHGSHITHSETISNTHNTVQEPITSKMTTKRSSTAIERLPTPPTSQIEDWKQRAHEAVWATNSYQSKRRRCRSPSNQDPDISTACDDDHDDNAESNSQCNNSSQSTSRKKMRTTEYCVTCEQCNIHFTRHRDLKRHNLSKHERQRYACDYCFESFTRSDSKVRHVRRCKSTNKKNRHDH
ncbi:hypothetical protein K492DRAFT_192697 [Lichtheimia hyalospora FSU 10163]|nr:hypothetical protein K492DRAFT_192697 [Lichtheimia hyalospora FSU 10163]